jgi:tetrahydromethanopterin S-methyltransferase subunit D
VAEVEAEADALVARFLGAATAVSTGVGTATTDASASAAGTSFLEATRLAFVVLGADVELIIPEEEELELIIIRTLLLSLNQFFSNFAVFF